MELKCSKCGHEFEEKDFNSEDLPNFSNGHNVNIKCGCGFETTTDYLKGFSDGLASNNKAIQKTDPYDLIDRMEEATTIRTTDALGGTLPKWTRGFSGEWGELI